MQKRTWPCAVPLLIVVFAPRSSSGIEGPGKTDAEHRDAAGATHVFTLFVLFAVLPKAPVSDRLSL